MTHVSMRLKALVVAQTFLLAALALGWFKLREAAASLHDNAANEVAADQLLSEIRVLRQRQSVADDEPRLLSLEFSDIVRAATNCGITEGQIRSVKHLTPATIDRTEYERQDTVIDLQSTSMEQVVRLALALEQSRGSFVVSSLQMAAERGGHRGAPPDGQRDERWTAQLILTRMVYLARNPAG